MEKPDAPPTKSGGYKKVMAIVVVIIVIAGIGVGVYEFTHPPTKKTIYFYSWWASTGKVALDHVISSFEASHPNIKVEQTIKPGAAGVTAIGAILTLMKEGKAPNMFQSLYGPQILSYVETAPGGSSAFVKMNSVASSINLTTSTVFPQDLYAGTFNGTMFSLPVDLHQGGVLYFNPQTLKEYGLPAPINYTLLLSDTAALEAKGVTPWIIPGDDGGYDQGELWESLFLRFDNSICGNATLFDKFMYGTLNLSNSTASKIINETNDQFVKFQKESYSAETSMTWTEAIPKVLDKDVGFEVDVNSYTNYAYDYLNVTTYPVNSTYVYMNNGTLKPDTGNIRLMSMDFPGTSKYFMIVSDSIAVPSGPTATQGLTFAKFFASYNGQMIFTKWKASSYYNNITTDYYNTPSQYASYQQAKAEASIPSDWIVDLDAGGLFAGPTTSLESGLLGLVGSPTSSGITTFDNQLSSVISSEKSDWLAANGLGFGFMGTLSHPFGGYLPPWVNSSTSTTVTADNAVHTNTSSNYSSSIYYVIAPFIAFVLGSLIMSDKR